MFWENILSDTVQVCPLGAAKHIFSHVEWHMTGYEIRLKKKPEWSGLLREAKEKQAEAGVPLPAWNLLAVSKEEFETKLVSGLSGSCTDCSNSLGVWLAESVCFFFFAFRIVLI